MIDNYDPRVKIAPCGCLTDGAGFMIQAICAPHAMALAGRARLEESLLTRREPYNYFIDPAHCEICAPQADRLKFYRCSEHAKESAPAQERQP